MKSPGGCPTASTCVWAPNADDARWVTCGLCGIERVDPQVQAVVQSGAEAADRARTLSERFCGPNRVETTNETTATTTGAA